jgi:hypothetical protein
MVFDGENTHFFIFTTYNHIKLHLKSLKRLKDAGDGFLLSVHLGRVCVRMGRHTDTIYLKKKYRIFFCFLSKSS